MVKYFLNIFVFIIVGNVSLYSQTNTCCADTKNKDTGIEVNIYKVNDPFRTLSILDKNDNRINISIINLGSSFKLKVTNEILIKSVDAQDKVLQNPYITLNSKNISFSKLKELNQSLISDIEFVEDTLIAVQRFGDKAKNGAIIITQ